MEVETEIIPRLAILHVEQTTISQFDPEPLPYFRAQQLVEIQTLPSDIYILHKDGALASEKGVKKIQNHTSKLRLLLHHLFM